MTMKNNKAAQKILQLEPQAAEQFDSRGRNFLHTAIMKGDFESVLFLISINVNVHSRFVITTFNLIFITFIDFALILGLKTNMG